MSNSMKFAHAYDPSTPVEASTYSRSPKNLGELFKLAQEGATVRDIRSPLSPASTPTLACTNGVWVIDTPNIQKMLCREDIVELRGLCYFHRSVFLAGGCLLDWAHGARERDVDVYWQQNVSLATRAAHKVAEKVGRMIKSPETVHLDLHSPEQEYKRLSALLTVSRMMSGTTPVDFCVLRRAASSRSLVEGFDSDLGKLWTGFNMFGVLAHPDAALAMLTGVAHIYTRTRNAFPRTEDDKVLFMKQERKEKLVEKYTAYGYKVLEVVEPFLTGESEDE